MTRVKKQDRKENVSQRYRPSCSSDQTDEKKATGTQSKTYQSSKQYENGLGSSTTELDGKQDEMRASVT